MNRVTKGAYHEILATAWLLRNDYHVFRNVSFTGPVDLVAMKGSQTTLIDVKAASFYNGRRLSPALSKEQIALGVKLLAVWPDGICVLDFNPPTSQRNAEPVLLQCVQCSKEFKSKTPKGRFCTIVCSTKHGNAKYRAKIAAQRAICGP